MKSRYYYINLTDQERVNILHSLINKRNKLIEQGRYINLVDEVITKITKAKKRRYEHRDIYIWLSHLLHKKIYNELPIYHPFFCICFRLSSPFSFILSVFILADG